MEAGPRLHRLRQAEYAICPPELAAGDPAGEDHRHNPRRKAHLWRRAVIGGVAFVTLHLMGSSSISVDLRHFPCR